MQAFVPKTRRPRFDLALKVIDLNNVPLVSGTSFVKWHLTAYSTAEHSGRTNKCQIRDHKVTYDYERSVPVRLTIDRNGMLHESWIAFEVFQEYAASARGERISLGHVRLNLAEYVDAGAVDDDDGVYRRYLMQDSKINSTLKIGIHMRQTEGDTNFVAPPLKSASVFGGIAGIISGEQGDADDSGTVQSLTTKSKEHYEYQDMYRANLAAYWSAQPGELRADECIEDIFAGGDGWAKIDDPNHPSRPKQHDRRDSAHSQKQIDHHEHRYLDKTSYTPKPTFSSSTPAVSGRSSLEQHAHNLKAEAAATQNGRVSRELDDLKVRADLKSWKLPSDRAAEGNRQGS